jgi:DHA1 family multidrug resistance protein-like MFS transporter
VAFYFICVPDAVAGLKLSGKQLAKEANPFQAFLDCRLFMSVAFAMLFAVNILINFANTGFDQVFNYYLKAQLGLSSSYNGIIKAAVGLISFVFNMSLCLWIIRKTNTKVSLAVLMGLCALTAAGTLVSSEMGLFIGLSVFVYAGYSVSLPVLQHMVAEEANPAQKNLVMGFYNAIKSLGSVVGSLMAGFLYAVHIKLPFAVVAVAYGLSCLAAIGYLMKKEN